MFAEFTTGNWIAFSGLLITVIIFIITNIRLYLKQSKDFIEYQTKTTMKLQEHEGDLIVLKKEVKNIADKQSQNHIIYIEKLEKIGNALITKLDDKFMFLDKKIDSKFEYLDKKIK